MRDKSLSEKTPVTETELIESIRDFYTPRSLVRAICDIGRIPPHSLESHVGVGFIDIADYTYLSKFLSPKENQILLNGLYTAFQIVLERHGGYMNKIEGDSMMFQFDDVLDRRLRTLDKEERLSLIARELFFTCVEMQRICILFNHADGRFIDASAPEEAHAALSEAFDIINSLRSKNDLSSTLFAFFQIRIRIGANIGEVTIGNFGPYGSKHWDVIGLPVINAKRMESTAPVGGLRISAEFYDILERNGIADDYLAQFKAEASAQGSVYRYISKDELFNYREVTVREKHGARYPTYSVQVYPTLPESICRQTQELLLHGEGGAKRIVEFVRYYRGNHYVIDRLEALFEKKGVVIRKRELLELVHPKLARVTVGKKAPSLFTLLGYLDRYLDYVQSRPAEETAASGESYDSFISSLVKDAKSRHESRKKLAVQKSWLFEVVIPVVYSALEASIREYQKTNETAAQDADRKVGVTPGGAAAMNDEDVADLEPA